MQHGRMYDRYSLFILTLILHMHSLLGNEFHVNQAVFIGLPSSNLSHYSFIKGRYSQIHVVFYILELVPLDIQPMDYLICFKTGKNMTEKTYQTY
jgi:hypothetical protein